MTPTPMPHRDQAFRDQPGLFDQTAAPVTNAASKPASPSDGPPAVPADQGEQSRDETYRDVRTTHDLQRQKWLVRIMAAGRHGVTLDELSARHGVPPNTFSGRITELKNAGLVVRTGERRPTRAGSTAAVIVAAEFLHRSRHSPSAVGQSSTAPDTDTPSDTNPHDSTSEAPMASEILPDQLTNTSTPRDTSGRPLEPERWYRVSQRGGRAVRVKVYEDEQANLCCAVAGEPGQRIDEMAPGLTWERA